MASTAVSEMIFFIVALFISAGVAGILIGVVDNYSSDIEDAASDLSGEMRSKVGFINDQANVPYNSTSTELTFYLMNTGSGDLSAEDLVVSANGTALAGDDLTTSILGGGRKWSRGKVVEVNLNVTGLQTNTDYHGWASTTGMSDSGSTSGHARDSITFRIWRY